MPKDAPQRDERRPKARTLDLATDIDNRVALIQKALHQLRLLTLKLPVDPNRRP